jgi:hypothetical protein
MKLVSSQRSDDLQTKIKSRFAEFNRSSSPSKGRRYPEELQKLVRQALEDGVGPTVVRDLTGISSTALQRWSKAAKPARARRLTKPSAPRRLAVVRDVAGKRRSPIVVRLPSGVSIEFGDGTDLNADLLTTLGRLGVARATTR